MTQKKKNIHPVVAFILAFTPLVGVIYLQITGAIFAIQWGVAICGQNCSDMEEYTKRLVEFSTGTEFNVITLIFYAVMALILYSIWYRMVFHKDEKFTNPFKGMAGRPVLFIVGLIVFAIGAQYLCSYIAQGLGAIFPSWMARYVELMEQAGLSGDELGLVSMIYAVILGPIVEEVAFRGLTYHYAKICMPALFANILQAFLFGALHGNMIQGSFAFVLGMLLGYIYLKYNNLAVTIIIHILYNSLAFLMEIISSKFVSTDISDTALTGSNFANPGYAIGFAIFFFFSMVITYLGILMLNKAYEKKEVKISE